MLLKYRVHAGHCSVDGRLQFVPSNQVIALYKVPHHECLISHDGYIPKDDKLINLRPDPSGEYILPCV